MKLRSTGSWADSSRGGDVVRDFVLPVDPAGRAVGHLDAFSVQLPPILQAPYIP
jgi:hypothetical protein